MMAYVPLLMFCLLFVFVFLGIPVSFSLIATSFLFGMLFFGDTIFQQMYGSLLQASTNFTLSAIPLFVLMGAILEQTGLARRLYNALQLWLGGFSGGLAISTMLMCGIFAAASGIVGAVEIVVGLMAIPAMTKYRYDRSLISGTICAGGSLGTIIPPSVIVVVYASMAQLSIGQLFAATLIPGLLMMALFLLYIGVACWLRPALAPAVAEMRQVALTEKLRITLKALVPPFLLIAAVLGSMLMGIASPTESAAVGAFGAALLALCFGELSLARLGEALVSTVRITAMIMLIVVGGTLFTAIFAISGGGWALAEFIQELALSPYWLIFALLLIVLLAGMVLDWISIVLIFVPIFTPLIKLAGIDPVWFAVMFMVVIQTSYLTPPMAPSIFYLKSIAPPDFGYGHMYRGVIPFILIQLLLFLIILLLPGLATWLPRQLF
ncbi:TRAP transporter large permease subunit [Pseudomonas lalucatii]|uniref:TRAP transporter large permease protein n=1 Tax=Pseudomonas lalucatii TaxID=1424203 RepID=A0ABS5PZE5_9PSED|nr:TRAP transporter large permease subunit [Pseudomonas lalucatii]MBS7661883.1 TRAP transporter large permease subunit [Pseudomonas lalucatii]